MLRLEADGWYLIGALVLLELTLLALIIALVRLRRKHRREGSHLVSAAPLLRMNAALVEREIGRLRAGEVVDDSFIKQLSPEDRAMFEVFVIDALNKASREDQHRLRSALVKWGYDEQCARRVMGEDISDRVRASALLALLRPQWRKPSIEVEQRPTNEGTELARAARRTTGPLDRE
ncbi:MAG TPA: hypothetical protein VLM38_12535 [Blastocatellia bacterium]|nr:hypothetical protein [Blastocatellia bacterium]